MMWVIIIGGIFLFAIGSLFFLASRFGSFSWIRRLTGGRKALSYLAGLAVVLLAGTVLTVTLDYMNTAICMLHLTAIWLLAELIGWIAGKGRGKKLSQDKIGVAAIVVTAVYLCVGWYLAHHVFEQRYELNTEKSVGTFRIVAMADAHLGTTFEAEEFENAMREIAALSPDVVVIVGDYVDDASPLQTMIECTEKLPLTQPTFGIYYVFGNHDRGYYGPEGRGYDGDRLVQELEKNGVRVLEDETILIDDRVYLIGRKDKSSEHRGGRATMEQLTAGLDDDKYQVVLDHQPNDYDSEQAAGVDLVLSGHTHGGQMIPVNPVGVWMGANDKTYGLEQRGDTNFIVTSGISCWEVKFKTGCKSEYVVIDIRE